MLVDIKKRMWQKLDRELVCDLIRALFVIHSMIDEVDDLDQFLLKTHH